MVSWTIFPPSRDEIFSTEHGWQGQASPCTTWDLRLTLRLIYRVHGPKTNRFKWLWSFIGEHAAPTLVRTSFRRHDCCTQSLKTAIGSFPPHPQRIQTFDREGTSRALQQRKDSRPEDLITFVEPCCLLCVFVFSLFFDSAVLSDESRVTEKTGLIWSVTEQKNSHWQ